MEHINMSIGEVLKERRIELSVKQEDLAERMNVTVQTVSKWERGLTEPKASQVAELAKILELSEQEICQGERKSHGSIDPFEFVKIVSSCIKDVSETELILTIYDALDNPEMFAFELAEKADEPFFTHKEKQREQAKMFLEMYEKGTLRFSDDLEKKRCLMAWNELANQ